MKYFLFNLLCFASFISSLPKWDIGGLSHTALGWVIPLFTGLYFTFRSGRLKLRFPLKFWKLWVILIFIHIVLFFNFMAFQRSIMLLSPLLMGILFGSMDFKEVDINKINRSLIYLLLSLFTVRLISVLIGFEVNAPGIVMTATLLACYFSTMAIEKNKKYYFFVVLAVLIPVVGINRMAILAALVGTSVSFIRVSLLKKLIMGSLILTGGYLVFYSSNFQEKMFYSGTGTFSTFLENPTDIRTHGRLVMWEPLWEEFKNKPILGHGIDSSTSFIKNFISWITHPHNDYLRILFDLGILGLAVFVIAHYFQMRNLYHNFKNLTGNARILFLFGLFSFIPFFFLMSTGNPIYYINYYGNLQFAIIGIAYSMSKNQELI